MAKKIKAKDNVHIDVIVKADKHDVVAHAGKCPIANTLSITGKGEILAPKVHRVIDPKTNATSAVRIVFSRRSTNTRYEFMTKAAVKFLDKWDAGVIPGHFRLLLKDSHLVSTKPRGKVDPTARRRTTKKLAKPRRSNTARPLPTKAA